MSHRVFRLRVQGRGKTTHRNVAATAMLHRRDGARFPPDVMLGVQARGRPINRYGATTAKLHRRDGSRVKGRSTFPKCTEKRVCTYKHSTHRLYNDILT